MPPDHPMKTSIFSFTTAGLLLALLLAPPAFAQQAPDSTRVEGGTSQWPRFGVGVQMLPISGVSLRIDLTQRVVVQVLGMPPGLGNQGAIGGRLLFRPYVRETYNLFLAGTAAAIFLERLAGVSRVNGSIKRQYEAKANFHAALTLGAEAMLGSHFRLSGELGAIYVRIPAWLAFDPRRDLYPAFGVALHYYF